MRKYHVFLPRDIPWAGGRAGVLSSSTHYSGEALIVFWDFILKLCKKKLIFLEILEKKFLQMQSRVKKWLLFFLLASRRQWEGSCRRLNQSSKSTLGRSMRKCRNRCSLAFALGARGKELGFSMKVTMFLSPNRMRKHMHFMLGQGLLTLSVLVFRLSWIYSNIWKNFNTLTFLPSCELPFLFF